MHATSCEVRDADHCVDHRDRHQGRHQDVDRLRLRQHQVRHQGERLRHRDHQDEDQNQDVRRRDRRGEHQDRQDVRRVRRDVRHQGQDGNQVHQDERQGQDGNQLRRQDEHHQEERDHQVVVEWDDRSATWGQVEAEWVDHQGQHHQDVAAACQEATAHDLQEVRDALLAAG